jgi:hypothetical protein
MSKKPARSQPLGTNLPGIETIEAELSQDLETEDQK